MVPQLEMWVNAGGMKSFSSLAPPPCEDDRLRAEAVPRLVQTAGSKKPVSRSRLMTTLGDEPWVGMVGQRSSSLAPFENPVSGVVSWTVLITVGVVSFLPSPAL